MKRVAAGGGSGHVFEVDAHAKHRLVKGLKPDVSVALTAENSGQSLEPLEEQRNEREA